jgi:hypothetical protein
VLVGDERVDVVLNDGIVVVARDRPRDPLPGYQYDLREENNPNAPHPPIYYVLKANEGEK